MNRELSWLKFNERVLEEVENKKVPLCERLTFASIYQSNLDEFFRVRVGSLIDQMLLGGKMRDNKTKMTAKEQIQAVLHQVTKFMKQLWDSLRSRESEWLTSGRFQRKKANILKDIF